MQCEGCKKELKSYEIFGPVGRTLCYSCEQKRQTPRLLLVEAYTVYCGSCGHSIDRYPLFLGDDYYFECKHCDADNVYITHGRAIGPKSKHWALALELFQERDPEDLLVWGDGDVKTDPPLSFCVIDPRRNCLQIDIIILHRPVV